MIVVTSWFSEEVAVTDTVGDTDSVDVVEGVPVGVSVTEIVNDGVIVVVGEEVTDPPQG